MSEMEDLTTSTPAPSLSGIEPPIALQRMLEGLFPTDIQLVRPDIKDSLDRYVQNHTPCGSFLKAVLSNDLVVAVSQADYENLITLSAIVSYLYNDMPSASWGSPAAYLNWIGKAAHTAM